MRSTLNCDSTVRARFIDTWGTHAFEYAIHIEGVTERTLARKRFNELKKKPMKKRFKAARIASSDNYELSRRIHSQYLKRWHNANIEVITEITTSLVIKEQKYIRVFGELIPISEEELRIHNTLIIEN